MLKDRLNQDIKTALLGGDKQTAEVLKSLKAAILYEEVAKKVRDTGLPEDQLLVVLARESKKRAESAQLYTQGGRQELADKELAEKAIIDSYLPQQLSDDDLKKIVDDAIADMPNPQMGPVIGAVKAKVGQSADGARVASMVKERLQA